MPLFPTDPSGGSSLRPGDGRSRGRDSVIRGVWGLGFTVKGLGLGVSGLGAWRFGVDVSLGSYL